MRGRKFSGTRRAILSRMARLAAFAAAVWTAAAVQAHGRTAAAGRSMQEPDPQGVGFRDTLPVPRNRQTPEVQQAAELLEELLEALCETGREEEAAAVQAYAAQLLREPLNLNRASRAELERLMLLSDYQIGSLLEYRREHGDVLSGAELSLLNGFSAETVRRLRPFIRFGPGGPGAGGEKKRNPFRSVLLFKIRRSLHKDAMFAPITQQELNLRPESRYIGTPYYTQLRYSCSFRERFRAGILLENDIGEPFLGPSRIPLGDFASFHLAAESLPLGRRKKAVLERVVAGDFSARFGQGLTLWNAFSFSLPDDPGGLYKKGSAVAPYTSADENRFLRGIAASFRSGGFSVSVALSRSGRDAAVSGDVYTALVSDGLHNTFGSMARRKTLRETLAGFTAGYRFNRFRAGVSAVVYGYDKRNARAVREYNRHQQYDGYWGNFSADFFGTLGRVHVFGELAADKGGHGAALLGVLFPAGNSGEAGFLVRSYSKAYIAPHAGAHHTGSGCYNQSGVSAAADFRLHRNLRLALDADAVYYPWMRYGTNGPSGALRGTVKITWRNNGTELRLRLREQYAVQYPARPGMNAASGSAPESTPESALEFAPESSSGNPRNGNPQSRAEADRAAVLPESRPEDSAPGKRHNRVSLQGAFRRQAENRFRWGVRVEAAAVSGTGGSRPVSFSGMAAAEAGYETAGRKFRLAVQGAGFCVPGWTGRIYLYENDLPHTFASRLLYGKGCCGYLLVRYGFFRRAAAWLKLDGTACFRSGTDSPARRGTARLSAGIQWSMY